MAELFNLKERHFPLYDLLRMAYSAEKAAAFAYQGHAKSLKTEKEKNEVKQIELDEWKHREEVLAIMQTYEVPVSIWYEIRFHVIGKLISWSCFFIGRFMPFYFAGRLESGNVCEYFRMIHFFHSLGINKHDQALYDMGVKEKEHEIYFLEKIKTDSWLPFFEKYFKWGLVQKMNDVELNDTLHITQSDLLCKKPNK